MANNLAHKTVNALINQAIAIEDESAQEAGSLGFMARAMVQATLPHRKVEGSYFERKNGAYTLTLLAPPNPGLPYGTLPRLLLAWLTTEAVKTQQRDLALGDSLSGFMRELDIVPTGGRWGSITRLKNQTKRLFSSSISAVYQDGPAFSVMNQTVADHATFWWDAKSPEQVGLWNSNVVLSEQFFKEIIENPVPIDMRAVKALKQSSMALDIYTWLTYRVSYLKKPTLIPWVGLAMQFGSDYSRLRAFKEAFLVELKKVVLVYPQVNVEPTERGLLIRPSLTHIPMKRAGK